MEQLFIKQWIKQNLESHYQFVKVLKRKDEGDIILYKHKELGKYVIKKELSGHYPVYKILLNMRHINIPAVYEYVEDENSVLILEEYIDGITINDCLKEKLFTEREMIKVIVQVCDAIYALHSKAIIHRDLKPDNIMIDMNNVVKLIDYDISKIHKAGEEKDTRVLGTVGYAAPEQFGITQSNMRSDIYAMGILMNVMLTGEHPSQAMYSGKVKRVIEKCTHLNPDKRYFDILQLKRKLLHY